MILSGIDYFFSFYGSYLNPELFLMKICSFLDKNHFTEWVKMRKTHSFAGNYDSIIYTVASPVDSNLRH